MVTAAWFPPFRGGWVRAGRTAAWRTAASWTAPAPPSHSSPMHRPVSEGGRHEGSADQLVVLIEGGAPLHCHELVLALPGWLAS